MTVPSPPMSLDGSCSAVYDNTLYVYTPGGFASLELKEGAKWTKLDMGVSVTGASCVGSNPANAADAGFWVVGGQGADDFTGLQKYTYANSNWTTITPTNMVTRDRQWHSAAYMQADDVIMIYGGNQNGVQTPNAETYCIGATAPYTTEEYTTGSSPSTISAILMQWSVADIAMVGGDASNTHVYLFNPNAKWRDFGTTLAQPFAKDISSMQAALVDGDDGSKSLYTFDMSASPNKVERMIVQDANGAPVQNSAPVTDKSSKSKSRRGLTIDNWPSYNSTLAPTDTRSGFSIAQGDDGQVVFVGGGSSKSPLAMFDVDKNGWEDPSTVFSGSESIKDVTTTSTAHHSTTKTHSHTTTFISSTRSSTISTTSTTSTTSSTTSAATASQTAAPAAGLSSDAILGVTLGAIGGFLLLLGLLLLCVKRRQHANKTRDIGRKGRSRETPSMEKDSAIAKETMMMGSKSNQMRGHNPQLSQESYSSMAILMGRVGQQKPPMGRPSIDSRRVSDGSIHKQFKSTISKPIPQPQNTMMQTPAPLEEQEPGRNLTAPVRPRHPSQAPDHDGTRRSSGWNRYWSGGSALQILGFGGKRKSSDSDESSRYSDADASNGHHRVTQDSAAVPPLNFKGRPSMSRVNSGSPIVSQYSKGAPEGMVAKIERPVSKASSGYSSGIPESVHDSWDPTSMGKPWGTERAPSSAYAPSFQLPHDEPAPRRPPTGVSQQPQLAMAAKSSDMSWLNLGDHNGV